MVHVPQLVSIFVHRCHCIVGKLGRVFFLFMMTADVSHKAEFTIGLDSISCYVNISGKEFHLFGFTETE